MALHWDRHHSLGGPLGQLQGVCPVDSAAQALLAVDS